MSTDVDEAFDNLTDVIQENAKRLKPHCCCCGADWKYSIQLFFCDTHYKKYKDIIGIDRNESRSNGNSD